MRRTTDRLAVFGLALLFQTVAQAVLGPPPDGRPSWLAWGLERASRALEIPPRLRPLAPLAAAAVAVRGAALLEQNISRRRPGGWSRLFALATQGVLLAATFDVWRSLSAATAAERELSQDEVDPTIAAERVEAELGSLAQGVSEGVVGPWAAYAAFDLPGAVAYAAVESLGGRAGGVEGPLATLIDPRRRLISVRRARDTIAGAATLAARGRGELAALDLEEFAIGSETPLPVTAMTVALDRRLVWNGRVAGWARPAPSARDLARGRRLAMRSLGILAAAAALCIALGDLLRPLPAEAPKREDEWS